LRPGARPDVGPPPRFITSEPRLGFGAWAVGGRSWGPTGDAAERESAIRRALERGITFFDTAPTYGDGESERLLGRALRAHRERVAIATKVGPHDDPRASLEGSLRRLADRKSTRLNSSHVRISYAVFCLKKKKQKES